MILDELLARIAGRNIVDPLRTGKAYKDFVIDTTETNSELARALYQNKDTGYNLGGAFIPPIINSTSGFMGVPNFRAQDERAQEILDAFALENTTKVAQAIQEALVVGDAYLWLTREEEDNPLYPESGGQITKLTLIPKEEVKEIILDPITREPKEYRLRSKIKWTEDGIQKQSTIKQTINTKERITEYDGDLPEGAKRREVKALHWGVVPILHLRNEPSIVSKYGKSEIEKVEPYIKAYHEILRHAIKGSKMHSTPRLFLQLKDVPGFLRNNFGYNDQTKTQTVDLDGHEIIIGSAEDKAGFIEAKSATGDATALLKLIFYCIVDVSEVPEFIFGVHTPSSLASVREQMPIMINKIKRKRAQYTEVFQNLGRLLLHMEATATGQRIADYTTTLEWQEIDPRSDNEIADGLDKVVSALVKGVNGQILSEEAAVDYLSGWIDTMQSYTSDDSGVLGEAARIAKTRRLRNRYADARGFSLELEELAKLKADEKAAK